MKQHNPNAFRHRKHIPYGSKGYCGYGGEFYSRKHGEIIVDIINKSRERQNNKMNIIMKNEELENKNLNDSAYKEDLESDPDLEEDEDN